MGPSGLGTGSAFGANAAPPVTPNPDVLHDVKRDSPPSAFPGTQPKSLLDRIREQYLEENAPGVVDTLIASRPPNEAEEAELRARQLREGR
jgi:hypothetical protein